MKMNVLMILMLIVSCARSPQKRELEDKDQSRTIKKDYIVRDASSSLRPGWIVSATDWAHLRAKKDKTIDTATFRYFSFETEPRTSREMACNLAKANVRADVASEITTFIQKTLAETTEGQTSIDPENPETLPLRSFVQNELIEKVQAVLTGASIEKTYWELRQYQQALGAARDYRAFTCAVLVRMSHEIIQRSLDQVRREMMNRASNEDLKQNIEKALEKADEDFKNLRGV